MSKLVAHLFVILTVVLSVYSQLIIKWQVNQRTAGEAEGNRILFVLSMLTNPWVLSGITATFLSGITWMLAMTRFEISYAYLFISLVFVLVPSGGYVFFNEAITPAKVAGSVLIMLGVIVVSLGNSVS